MTEEELRWAVEHALQTHALAEEERERLAGCTDAASLRRALIEVGLPEQDVEQSLATLEHELLRRHGARRRRMVVVAVAAAALVALGLIGWFALLAPLRASAVFINLRHEAPNRRPHHSWQTSSLDGRAERALAAALSAQEVVVIDALDADVHRRLFVGAQMQPTRAALKGATAATHAALGDLRCDAAGDGVRATLSLRVIDLRSGAVLERARAEGAAQGSQIGAACEAAGALAARTVAAKLAGRVAARLGRSR